MQIKKQNLSQETRTILKHFGRAASRYYDQRSRITEFVSNVGPVERIVPKSTEIEYFEAKNELLACTDHEIRGVLDQIDQAKLLDALEGKSPAIHTAAYNNMVRIEKQLIELAKS